jgi:hypothetical protein
MIGHALVWRSSGRSAALKYGSPGRYIVDSSGGAMAIVSPAPKRRPMFRWLFVAALLSVSLAWLPLGLMPGAGGSGATAAEAVPPPIGLDDAGFDGAVKPLLAKYCLGCHATAKKEGGLDLERFTTVASIRRDVKPWQNLIEQVEAEEMPPREKPQPTAEERHQLVAWTRGFLDAEARARTGDPGRTLLRRLSNAEYDATIRDLTGVDLRPAREFPADGAGGEGFTNAGESLSEISPALFARYMAAAKEIANRAVLLPEGLRFSPSVNRRDWTDEAVANLQKFYASMTGAHAGIKPDGGLDFQPYLLATVRDRELLAAGKLEEVAAKHKPNLNVIYLRALWQALSAAGPSQPLDDIRAAWRQAKEADVPALAASIAAWRGGLWRTDQVGNYARGNDGQKAARSGNVSENLSRQVTVDPPAADAVTLRVPVKPARGQSEVAIHLAAREPGSAGPIVWHRPRFEGKGKPVLLLRDYPDYGPAFEVDSPSAFTKTAAYLSAVVDLTHGTGVTPESVAEKQSLDVAFLRQWVKFLGIEPTKPSASSVPDNSVLGQWRVAAADLSRRAEAAKLAEDVARLLGGPRPAGDQKDPNLLLYDRLVSAESPLFAGVDLTRIAKPTAKSAPYGLAKERFVTAGGKTKEGRDPPAADSLVAASDAEVVIRLPAALLAGREFVVDAQLPSGSSPRFVRVRATSQAVDATTRWDGPVLATVDGPAYKAMLVGNAAFRELFPLYVCFPPVRAPHDEAISLKLFHREDEPLLRLFATPEQARDLDRMWDELVLISRQPVAEYDYFPQMMGFASQDTSPAFQKFYADYKPVLQKRVEAFLVREKAAIPRQLAAIGDFAARAYRRPLSAEERTGLQTLYDRLRSEGMGHDEAFRGVVSSALVSPAFLFRIETPPAGKQPARVNDHELATRLSYFLWSSMPDAELREAADSGRMRDPAVLAAQARRMLQDPRARALAIEFGTQWIHVRGLDEFKEKNESLYPTFDAALRKDLYEESILFFLDFFQSDRPVRSLLDADHMFVNEAVAKHYGIPNVAGPQWRRIDGARKLGRGGILGLASVQAKQSGASRTSPVLRGTWVVETLLGEKLPKPPKNVPQLPDQEGLDNLTTRQMVERHVSDASCAACHARIDPYGFAFESFDAIGRFRTQEAPGRPVDTKAKLRDGTEFTGLDGLREYLVTKKQPEFVRLFCQRLLGYALGRSTTLSDTAVIDKMAAAVQADGGRVSGAIGVILESPQFLMVRGKDAEYSD